MLLGRADECAMVDGVLGHARAGASRVLLVAGEPGVGKSALLEYAVESASASGFQVVRASGAESEMELAFAGLQQLCAPLLDGSAQLPGPQRSAIETAFGVSAGVPPDPFFVGLGVLGLLAAAASARPMREIRPLVCSLCRARLVVTDRRFSLDWSGCTNTWLACPAMIPAGRSTGRASTCSC